MPQVLDAKTLRRDALPFIQKREELNNDHKRLCAEKSDAMSRGDARKLQASSEQLAQKSAALMQACAELDTALDDVKRALDAEFLRDNREAESKLTPIRERVQRLHRELAQAEAEERDEIARIQPDVDRIAEAKRAGEQFIADEKRTSADYVRRLCLVAQNS